jgi:hypothetical protein
VAHSSGRQYKSSRVQSDGWLQAADVEFKFSSTCEVQLIQGVILSWRLTRIEIVFRDQLHSIVAQRIRLRRIDKLFIAEVLLNDFR